MTVLPADWALPLPNRLNEAWFTAQRLAVQRCTACDVRQHPPEEICHRCGGTDFGHDDLGPNGTVYSYTVAHYAVNRALADSVPYAVVLVSLDDDPTIRVVGNMPGTPLDAIHIGLPVTVTWEEHTAEDGAVIHLPQWAPR